MRRSLLFLASLLVPGITAAAHANTITAGTYTLQNASIGGYALTGTVTFNSTGNATAADLTLNASQYDNPGLPVFNAVSYTNVYNGLSQNYLVSSSDAGQIALYFNTAADANGYFDLCLGSAQCGTSAGTVDPSTVQIYGFYNSGTRTSNPGMAVTQFSSGYLSAGRTSPAAVTPEPATFLLLGTGVFGLSGAAVRRLRRQLL